MKRLVALLWIGTGLALPAVGQAFQPAPLPAASGARVRQRLDAGWRFLREETPVNPRLANGVAVQQWRSKAERNPPDETLGRADLDAGGADWNDAATGQDVFRGRRGFAWFRATLPAPPAGATPRALHFDGVDDNAAVYLNGQLLRRHAGWNDPFVVPLDPAWRAGGANVVAVLVENTDGPGGITGAVTLSAGQPSTPAAAQPGFDDGNWRVVHLPHDYVVEEPVDPRADVSHGFRPVHTAWYRKTFAVPASARGQSLWLDFDGVYRDSMVWLNGKLVGEQKSGYTPFRFDISDIVRPGAENVLAIHVDPRAFEGWWYEGGGIYRHVWLTITDPVHVAPWGTFVTATLPGAETGTRAAATLTLRTELENRTASAQACTLVSQVVGPDGRPVLVQRSRESVPAKGRVTARYQATFPRPQLWSIETPHRYRLVSLVQRGGRTVDRVETAFGIRTVRFDPDHGFFLNGKPVKLKGTCNHQDHAGVGIGVPDRLQEWRIAKLKAMGSNAYRCSHNPPAAQLLDACDRLGMLVLDESRHLGDTYAPKSTPDTPASDLTDLRAMLLRDRNHPSIIAWSLCNEEAIQGSPAGERIGRAMRQVCSELDGTRPVTAAMNGGFGAGLSNVIDLQGYNYSIQGYADYHRAHPRQPVYGSETASTVSTRGIYANDRERGYVSAYDANAPPWGATAERAWRPFGENAWLAGAFVWTGFDYKGEPTPYAWPCINSHFGILDVCGFPKDNYWYYLAWWGEQPVAHLLPHWNWTGKEGQPVAVWCHSNCERVELLLNGRSLGEKEMPRFGHLEWEVPYSPGRLEARGTNAGRAAATAVVETTGPPTALRLATDRTLLDADGEDVTVVEVAVVDAQGRVVPTAGDLVEFHVAGAGRIAGVGNGDPSSHEPDQAPRRRAFNGRCMVLVGAAEHPGGIQLQAEAAGLGSAALALQGR